MYEYSFFSEIMDLKALQALNNIGLLGNQTSYVFGKQMYMHDFLGHRLKRVFVPEHGFFSELQDQICLDDTSSYGFGHDGLAFVSMYGSDKENHLQFPASMLRDLDGIVIDIQDVGVRYFTYIMSVVYMLETMHTHSLSMPVFVVDHLNPNDKIIEGSPMQSPFASLIGMQGLPHSYGLTFYQLVQWISKKIHLTNDIIKLDVEKNSWIQPSPNLPTIESCRVYTGQCLIEGTTMSEGRGTTLPFQIFGSPVLKFEYLNEMRENIDKTTSKIPVLNDKFHLRPLKFIPTFHKHQDEICNGFQLHILDKSYHSLLLGMAIVKECAKYIPSDQYYKPGPYEFGNDRSAIELLVGDQVLLDFLGDDIELVDIFEYLSSKEQEWSSEIKDFTWK